MSSINKFQINGEDVVLNGVDMTLSENTQSEQPASCKSVNEKLTELYYCIGGECYANTQEPYQDVELSRIIKKGSVISSVKINGIVSNNLVNGREYFGAETYLQLYSGLTVDRDIRIVRTREESYGDVLIEIENNTAQYNSLVKKHEQLLLGNQYIKNIESPIVGEIYKLDDILKLSKNIPFNISLSGYGLFNRILIFANNDSTGKRLIDFNRNQETYTLEEIYTLNTDYDISEISFKIVEGSNISNITISIYTNSLNDNIDEISNNILDKTVIRTTNKLAIQESQQRHIYTLNIKQGDLFTITLNIPILYDRLLIYINDLTTRLWDNATTGSKTFCASTDIRNITFSFTNVQEVGNYDLNINILSNISEELYNIYNRLNIIENTTGGIDDILFLPKNLYITCGSTAEIYYSQIITKGMNYIFDSTFTKISGENGTVGYNKERKYQIKAGDLPGVYRLKLDIYNSHLILLKTMICTVHIVEQSTKHIKILPIGSSLVNQKPWMPEISSKTENIFTFVGTRGDGHEGRSGGGITTYLNDNGNTVYTYEYNYNGVGSDSDLFDESISYNQGDFCRKIIDNTNNYITYVFLTEHSGPWDDSHVHDLTTTNPFYDPFNKKWSLLWYSQFQQIEFDMIYLLLGGNGMTDNPDENIQGTRGMLELLQNIRTEYPNIPIIISNTLYKGGQNSCGKTNVNREIVNHQVRILLKSMENNIQTDEITAHAHIAETMDSDYVFGLNKAPVNPYISTDTGFFELEPSDYVHPQQVGYMQMADTILGTINYLAQYL